MKKVKMLDLMGYQFLSQLQASPDGAYAAYVINRQSRVTNGYQASIHLLDLTGEKPVSVPFPGEQPTNKSFVWDTADTILCAGRGKKGTAYTRRNVKTGESAPAFEVEYPASSIKPLIPGELYLLTCDVDTNINPDWTPAQKKDEQDYIRITELPFWDNGVGYVSGHRATLFLYRESTKELTALTAPMFNVGGVAVSEDKKTVVYTGLLYDRIKTNKNGMYIYNVETGETKCIIPQGEVRLGRVMVISGDKMFFSACYPEDDRYGNSEKDDIYLMDLNTLTFKKIADSDYTLGCNVSSDCRFGGGAGTGLQDGKLVYLTTEVDVCNLNTMTTDGERYKFPKFEGAVENFAVVGDKILFIAMAGRKLQEIYSYDSKNGYQQLTTINEAALEGRYIAEPEYAGFINSDGIRIDGWVLKPMNFNPKKSYPGILSMHGGPCVAWGQLFVHEMQMFASDGYFVFFCNPRGSDGRGAEFADLRGKFGTIDFQDFMEFTDQVLARYPDIDPARVGIAGGSYGGFMCNWMIGHTDRYAAAASQRSISNYVCKLTATDIGTTYDLQQVGATPWEDFDLVWETSPLKYAHNAKTPTLFIQADEDYRCWMSGAIQMFSALKQNGTDARLCLFHGENHELSRSGKPQNRVSRLTEIVGWMERYLK